MNSPRISIIDDEKPHYELVMRAIKKEFPDALIDYFEDAESFIQYLGQNVPDLIIIDYMLPGMNGLELLRKLKKENRSSNIPVIMATGRGSEHSAVEAMKLGAFDYVVKSGDFFSLIPGIIARTIKRKKTEDDLWEARQRFRTIFDYGGFGVLLTDQNGHLIKVNRKFCEMLGYDESELESKLITNITHEKDIPEGLELTKRLWSGVCKITRREKRYICKDGKEIWVMVTSGAVFGTSGKIKYLMSLVQDTTKSKKDEETIRQLYHRIISTQEIERKNIADKLHDDLGQILTVLKIGLDQLKMQWPSESKEAQERIDGLIELTRKTTETIRTLTYHLRPPILDDLGLITALNSLINQIEKQTAISIEFSSAGFKKRLEPEIEIILFRIIEECLTNIVKHSHASRASIHLIQSFPRVVVTVEDNGIGFNKKEILASSKAGSGLGLASIHERIEFLKGLIKINSVAGGGTCIRIEIPLAEADYEKNQGVSC